VNAKDKYDETALMKVAANGYLEIEICRMLIEKGADINAKDKYDWTALIYAASNGNEEICALLIKNGANIEDRSKERNWKGQTALEWAETNEKEGTAAFLKKMEKLQKIMGKESLGPFLSAFNDCIKQ
jgi:ankyrin repeat protein